MASGSLERFIADFDAVAQALPGARSERVARLRREALASLREAGLPTTRQEDWKYTSIAAIERKAFRSSAHAAPPQTARVEALLAQADLPGAVRLVFVNGRLDAAHSSLSALPPGLTVRPLGGALAELADELPAARGGFDALNLAFLTDGAQVRVAEGAELSSPLHLLFLALPEAEPLAMHYAVLVDLGAGSALQLVETYLGEGAAGSFTTTQTRVSAGPGARLERCRIEAESRAACHVGRTLIDQERDSAVTDHSISYGAGLTRHDLSVDLRAPGAACVLNGLYLADGRRHVDHHTRIDHRARETTSEELYKGVLDGAGRAVFNGSVLVHEGADKTSARQSNHNLLLSPDAEVDTKPELQILADDVKCAHGATVGQLDEDAMFYLRSRGIDQTTARGFLTYAFAAESLGRIGVAGAREHLQSALVGLLKAPAVLGGLP